MARMAADGNAKKSCCGGARKVHSFGVMRLSVCLGFEIWDLRFETRGLLPVAAKRGVGGEGLAGSGNGGVEDSAAVGDVFGAVGDVLAEGFALAAVEAFVDEGAGGLNGVM